MAFLRLVLPFRFPNTPSSTCNSALRFYSTSGQGAAASNAIRSSGQLDIRERLMSSVKTAMKNKDSFTSTTIRSVLSEIYTADKTSSEKLSSSQIISVIRKSTVRRKDSAVQYTQASRPDLAEKELREADVLSAFLPPLLSDAEIDRILQEVVAEQPKQVDPRRKLGEIYKAFYAKVDRSVVDNAVLKKRAEAIAS